MTDNIPKLSTVPQFCKNHPSFKEGGMRHILFQKRNELEEAGAITYFGRNVLIDEVEFIKFVKSGGAREIIVPGSMGKKASKK